VLQPTQSPAFALTQVGAVVGLGRLHTTLQCQVCSPWMAGMGRWAGVLPHPYKAVVALTKQGGQSSRHRRSTTSTHQRPQPMIKCMPAKGPVHAAACTRGMQPVNTEPTN